MEIINTEKGSLQERCLATYEKERVVVHRVDVLSEDVANLGQKMTNITLNLEEERLLRKKVEKDIWEVQIALVKEHDIGFKRVMRQAAFFYQGLVDEGKFDKDIYQGELTSIMDIPNEKEEEEAEAQSGASKASGDFSALDIFLSYLMNVGFVGCVGSFLMACTWLLLVLMVVLRSTFTLYLEYFDMNTNFLLGSCYSHILDWFRAYIYSVCIHAFRLILLSKRLSRLKTKLYTLRSVP